MELKRTFVDYHKGKHQRVTVNMTIDVNGLAVTLGKRAVRNRTRKSKLAAGVSVEVMKVEAVDG